MINVNTLFEAVCRLVNKTAQVAYVDFNKFLPIAERQLFDELAPPMPQGAYEINAKLTPFIVSAPITLDATGEVGKPGDLNRWLAARLSYTPAGEETATETEVKVVEHHRLGQALISKLCPPTSKYPICVNYADKIQFYPKTAGTGTLDYLRLPVASKWGFTFVNGRPVYDAATSVNSEFGEDCANELIVRTLALFGVNLKADDLTQYGEMKQKQVV
jgi:hypothetical protein